MTNDVNPLPTTDHQRTKRYVKLTVTIEEVGLPTTIAIFPRVREFNMKAISSLIHDTELIGPILVVNPITIAKDAALEITGIVEPEPPNNIIWSWMQDDS